MKDVRAFPLPPNPGNGQTKILILGTTEDGEAYRYDLYHDQFVKVQLVEKEPEKPMIHKV